MSPWPRFVLACAVPWSLPAFAQTSDTKKSDDDVVFDNRELSQQRKAEKKQENAENKAEDASFRRTFHGLELLNVQLGVDVRRWDEIFGVFLRYPLGRYTKYSFSGLIDDSGSIDESKIHNWLGVGVRGVIE